MSTATKERRGTTVKLELEVEVPSSADQGVVLRHLSLAAGRRQGVTITMPNGDLVDVDLSHVREVHP